MFGLSDLPKFFLAFFLVLPLISLIHEAGHVFFAWLMGGKNIRVTVGTGKFWFRIGLLEVRQYYFWYGFCSFDNLRRNERFSNILIFAGGSLFNAVSALLVVYLIESERLEPGMLTYQFTYFSLYYIFFSILPMPYPDGNASDGKFILDLIRHKTIPGERVYRLSYNDDKKRWCLLDHEDKELHALEEAEDALHKAREQAMLSRPSRLLHQKPDGQVEEHNFPRIPQ